MKISNFKLPAAMVAFASACFAQSAIFPGAISSSQNLKVSVNGVATLLTQNIGATDSIFSVSSCGPGIVPYVLITIDSEIMNVTGCSGTVMVVAGRGFDSTVATPHLAQAPIYAFVDAWHHNGMAVEIEAIETALGINLANVATTGSSPTFGGATISGNLSAASITDTGTLSVAGTSTMGAITSSGFISVTGTLSVTGTASGTHLQNVGTADSPVFANLTSGTLVMTPVTGSIISPIYNADVQGYTGNTFQNSDGSFGIAYNGVVSAQQIFATNTAIAAGPAGQFVCGQTSPTLTCGEAISASNNTPRTSSVNQYAFNGTTTGNNSLLLTDNGGTCTIGTGVGGVSCPVGPSYTRAKTQTFSALPSCSAGYFGSTAAVSDSTVNTWGTAIAGSGAYPVQAFCNGTSWTVAAH